MRIGRKLNIPLGMVILGNLSNVLYQNYSISYYLLYVGIFIPIAIAFHFIDLDKHKRKISLILFVLACIGFCFGEDSGLVGATFLTYSLFIHPRGKWKIPVAIGIFISISIVSYTLKGNTPGESVVYMAGSAFILILYFHYIHPKPPVIEKIPGFTDDHMEILTGMITGKKPKEIADEMCLSDSTIRNKQLEMREKLNVSTNEQLIYHLWGILKFKNPT